MSAPAPELLAPLPEAAVLAGVLEAAAMFGVKLDRHNVAAFDNPRGQRVRCGKPGDSDCRGFLPDGRALHVETKREGFDPRRCRGRKERERFARQLEKLEELNRSGGVGFWTDHPAHFVSVLRHVLAGARVEELGELRGPVLSYPTPEDPRRGQ